MSESLTPTVEATTAATSIYQGQHSLLTIVISKPGRGKSTAIRTLPPSRTHLINVMGKELPFQGASQYILGQNMTITAEGPIIREKLRALSTSGSCDYIVVDDLHYVMATEFMSKVMVKGYDKFSIMARNIWDLLVLANQLRPGLKVFFLTHEEETTTERKMKTLGKLLDEKISCEGLSTIVLWGEVEVRERTSVPRFYFSTQTDGFTNAKAPFDMFPPEIPNDLFLVSQRIDEYYAGVSMQQSKVLPRS